MSLWRNKFVLLPQNTSYETTALSFVLFYISSPFTSRIVLYFDVTAWGSSKNRHYAYSLNWINNYKNVICYTACNVKKCNRDIHYIFQAFIAKFDFNLWKVFYNLHEEICLPLWMLMMVVKPEKFLKNFFLSLIQILKNMNCAFTQLSLCVWLVVAFNLKGQNHFYCS